jgi:hypothetical protein
MVFQSSKIVRVALWYRKAATLRTLLNKEGARNTKELGRKKAESKSVMEHYFKTFKYPTMYLVTCMIGKDEYRELTRRG